MRLISLLVFLLVSTLVVSCQHAPRVGYTERSHVVKKRADLKKKLLQLLPENQKAAAEQEATWLADTAHKASAAIARYNDPIFMNWLNNRAINSKKYRRHRGLCWHYQHDLYRELRRRPLKYFTLGCCVRDQGRGGEHHVVYIKARNGRWPSIVMLDAWWYTGRLVVEDESDAYDWKDDPGTVRKLNKVYPEGHRKPIEHWAMIRKSEGYEDYVPSDSPAARNTPQWKYMQQQMKQGMKRRRGRPYDY
ncbi:MAG: hypothetical protein E7032_02000 [Akkermansiaceae bacterium]|nr:hypothetical protein [Akkermansiaceae bacterium]